MEKEKNKTLPNTEPTEKTVASESKTTLEKTVEKEPKLVAERVEKPRKASKLSADVQENKNIAWLAYILFFIPLLINRVSPFVRHHANEGLEINIFDAIAVVLLLIGGLVQTTVAWLQLLLIIFTIIGFILIVLTTVTKAYMIVSTLRGKAASTPWMWNLRIIK